MRVGHLPASRAVVLLALVARVAHADDERPSARADRLFGEAMALIEQGNYRDACPRLDESQRLDPGLGTQYNLALCEVRIGKHASAWRNLKAVATLAHASGKRAREEAAREKLREIAPRVPHLKITVADADATVRVDGEVVAREGYGFLAVDTGIHAIEAVAATKQKWSTQVTVPDNLPDGNGAAVEITVPPLLAVASRPGTREVIREPASGRRTAGYILGGVGIGGLAVAVTTGILVLDAKSTADERCTPRCADQTGRDAVSAGKTLLPVNAIAWGVGVVGVGAGATLLFLSPRTPRAAYVAPMVGSSGAGITMQGRF